MNRSLLTIGIILSLGSLGCAGLGVQPTSTLTSAYRTERGVDDLWVQQEQAPDGAETPLYAEQELGHLWDSHGAVPNTVVEGARDERRGGDLWNPASGVGSWDTSGTEPAPAYRLSRTSQRLWY